MIYNKIFQKIIFPLSEAYSGTTIQKKLKFLLKSQYWSKKQIEEYQNKRLRELIKHAYENVPYYTNLFDALGLKPSDIKTKKDLKKIPFLTKEIIRNNYEELRANNFKNKSFVKYTSGSTGSPMHFYLTKEDYSWIWAVEFRNWTRAGYNLGDKYVKLSLNNDRVKLSKQIQDRFMRCRYVYTLGMDENNIKRYIEHMIKYQPKIIYGYSSSLYILAKYMEKNHITYNPNAVLTTAENLLPSTRRRLEKVFKCKVYDLYGCGGEGLNIAAQCEKEKYHVNEEVVILEFEHNEILVTSLNNYAMPLIRYKPGDLVTSGSNCDCKRNTLILKQINGRSTDVVITGRGDVMTTYFFTQFLEYIEGIEEFQIMQNNINNITIKIVKNDKYVKDTETKIKKYIQKGASKKFEIYFQYVQSIPSEKNGKRKIIDNRLK